MIEQVKKLALHMCAAPTDYNGVQLAREEANELLDKILTMNKVTGQTLLMAVELLRRHR